MITDGSKIALAIGAIVAAALLVRVPDYTRAPAPVEQSVVEPLVEEPPAESAAPESSPEPVPMPPRRAPAPPKRDPHEPKSKSRKHH